MTFAPKEVILGASVPLENGGSVTFSVAGHIEAERDIDDAVVIFSRKLLKYTNSASDADRLTVRQIISSISSTPLDKVPDVGTPCPTPEPVEPAKAPASVTLDRASPLPERMPTPTAAEQAAAAVQRVIKPPAMVQAPDTGKEETGKEAEDLCEKCGAPVTKSQAKLSQLFMSKTLCKKCQAEASA